jgi:DNA-binding MarR family transcriptional regulator
MKHRKMLLVLEQFRIVLKAIRSHLRNVERRTGISGAQLWALAQVAAKPGIKVGELAAALAIHQSTASNLLRRLEQLRLVSRKREGADQRTVQLFATARGGRVMARAPRPRIGVLQQALSDLPTGSLERLRRQLVELVAAMKAKDLGARSTPISDLLGGKPSR